MDIKAKLRPFYVAKMLYEQTDEDHYLTIAQIMEQLEKEYPPKNFDLNVYLNSMFRMYNGQRKQIELVCSNDVMDAIIDKFGKDVHVLVNDMKSFRAIIETSVGSVFYSWIFGFGGKVVIKSPEDVKDEYSSMVLNAGKSLGLFEYGESENQTV